MRKLPLVLALTCLLPLPLALSSSARAAVLMALDLRQLVEQSDYVVVAKAVDDSSRYENTLIVTDVTLEIVTSLKGPARPGSSLTATHLGGSVGEIGCMYPVPPVLRSARAPSCSCATPSAELHSTSRA